MSLFNEERESHLKVGEIEAALALWAKYITEQKSFKICDLKIKLAALMVRKKSSTHQILSKNDKDANAGEYYCFIWHTIT